MRNITRLTNVHVASNPTYFPHVSGDPKKARVMLTVMSNYRRAGQDIRSDAFSLVFWGKLATLAAFRMPKGTCITVEAEPRSYDRKTGKVKAGGQEETIRETTYHVVNFVFSGQTLKAQNAIVTNNIAKYKAAGLIPADCAITSEMLLENPLPSLQDYNPAISNQTGMYGNAKVYIKDQGLVQAQAAGAAGAGQVQDLDKLVSDVISAKVASGELQVVAKDTESPVEEADVPFDGAN